MGIALSDEIKSLLDGPNYAHLATVLADGAPHATPVWVAREGDRVLLGIRDDSLKGRNTRRDPRVALSIVDVDDPYRMAELRGRVVERRPDPELSDKDVMSRKYVGKPFPWRYPKSVVLVIEVERARYQAIPLEHAPACPAPLVRRADSMRASYYHGDRTFKTGPAAMPVPQAGEALLRVRRVGICGTDLHIYQGHLDHRVPKNGIIGHETFAEIAEAPAGSGFAAGDRVVVEPLRVCGECRACKMGASYICYRLHVLGVDAPGGMQEYWAVPTARLLKVPVSLTDDHAALMEPLAIATHDVKRAQVKRGDAVVVLGCG